MSETTREALAAAQHEYERADEAEQGAGRALLKAVADGLPTQVDRLTRKAVNGNPDQVRKLGNEGIQQLRSSLRAAAEEVARQLQLKTMTPWRGTYSNRYNGGRFAITSALEDLFGYPQRNALLAPLQAAGFSSHPHPFPADVLAQVGAHEDLITAATQAAKATTEAAQRVREATRANDAQDVADAWGD